MILSIARFFIVRSASTYIRAAFPLALRALVLYDGHHMSVATEKRTAPSRKKVTHERIVETAARAIRRSGYDGTGVADIMKEAGLTHGGFYAHFDSREAMLAEAADRAGAEAVASAERIVATVPPERALHSLMQFYLSKEHVEDVESGCPFAALGSEMPRQAPEVRRSATRRIKEMIDLVARQSPDWGQSGAHENALVTVAAMVGTLVLARAVDDPRLSDALREAALKHFAPLATDSTSVHASSMNVKYDDHHRQCQAMNETTTIHLEEMP